MAFNPIIPIYIPIISPEDLSPKSDLENKNPYGLGNGQTLATGQLGIPVTDWIDFFDSSGNKILTIVECMITVTQNPKVSRSYSVGKDYSVKTFIGMDDYNITIEGYIFNVNKDGTSAGNLTGIYPADRVKTLLGLMANQGFNYGISVYSPYLTLFGDSPSNPNQSGQKYYLTGIDRLVITNIDIPQEEGGYSQQKFSISAISDSAKDINILYAAYTA